MRVVKYFLLVPLSMSVVCLGLFQAHEGEKPRYTIKEVMKLAHDEKTGLLVKVAAGKASKQEKEQLLDAYIALSQNKPPKGDAEEWKEKTSAIVKAMKEIIADESASARPLAKATNCKACHSVFKPK